jgi:PST family polysaccharide transporter
MASTNNPVPVADPEATGRSHGNSPQGQSTRANALWLFSERVFQLAVSFLVGLAVARYLGPAQFGSLAYTSTFVALFLGVCALGLSGITVQSLIREPAAAAEILGTAYLLQLGAGTLSYLLALWVARHDPAQGGGIWLMLCIGSTLVFSSVKILESWFQSRLEMRFPVKASLLAILVGGVAKLMLIAYGASIEQIVLCFVLEGIVGAFGLAIMAIRKGVAISSWRWSSARAARMLGAGWPIMVSTVVVQLYIRTDQVIVRHLLGAEQLGWYSAAARFSEMWYFVPTAIATAVFPKLAALRASSPQHYRETILKLSRIVVTVGCGISLALVGLAAPIVVWLLGNDYLPAVPVIRIYCLSLPLVFLGAVSSQWFIHEGLQIYSLYRNGAGVILNVILNLLLVPRFGILGSAVSTVAAIAVAAYLANAASTKTRELFLLHCEAIRSTFRGDGVRDVLGLLRIAK